LIRQLLVSLVILLAAAYAWLYFVPSAPQTVASWGISIPFAPSVAEAAAPGAGAPRGPAGAQGGPPAAGAPGGGRPGGFGGRTTNVITSAVKLATINDTLSSIGEGTPVRSVTVTAPAGGELAEILVRPGQRVEAGTIIARFDDAAEQIDYERALLAAEDARSALSRTSGLASSNVVANTAVSAAQLAASNAELALRNAEMALERRTITSPIAGTIGLIRVSPGNFVSAQTAITTIDDTSSILIDFWVPERYAAQIEPGMPVAVSAIALPGRSFTGDVSAVDSRIDPASRTLQVQAEIPNPDTLLRSGMSFTVALTFAGETFPAVNPLSILWSAEGSYVWKYQDGKATKVMAEIVQRNSDGVLVRGDLNEGDPIITEGILQLSEGANVNLLDGPDGSGAAAPATN
jgi:RND family efflux transporter MFP subunit